MLEGKVHGITTEIGKSFRVRVENHIQDPSLIHWHGLKPPLQQDGVPQLSGTTILPGGTADYSGARSGCIRIMDCKSSF
jgi:FtsP/CotA-like multicopper oxidase with cupredoxin domain